MSTTVKCHKLILPFVVAPDLGMCGLPEDMDVLFVFLCAAIKIVMMTQKQCLFPTIVAKLSQVFSPLSFMWRVSTQDCQGPLALYL